jgi:glutamate 5-kinase
VSALVLLSDIDGLYTADPRDNPDARHLDTVSEVTADIEGMAGQAPPGYSSGGMVTKLVAAKIALAAGCRMAIALGKQPNPLAALAGGGRATWFVPQSEPKTARKRWIAGSLMPVGVLTVDDGALKALLAGKSLLPAGVSAIEGEFERGDPVVVKSADGRELARGLCAYSAADARRIRGHKSGEIERLLGYRGRDEMIHRDDLVLTT